VKFPQFATPHCHPQSLDSASTVGAFAAREVELGGIALTCTDHGTLQAAQAVFEIAKSKKLQPIVGLEAYFRDDDDALLKSLGIPKTMATDKSAPKDRPTYYDWWPKYGHLTLHFMDYAAYLCGVRLLSAADDRAEQHGTERKPLFDWAAIEELASHNVTAGSSCLIGMVSRHLFSNGDPDVAQAYFDRLHHLFGDRFRVELFPHVCSHNWSEAVFLDVGGAPDPVSGKTVEARYYFGKTLLVRDAARPLADPIETKAGALEAVVKRMEQPVLVSVKHYRKWSEQEPQPIHGVRVERGFIRNDCTPAAPEGDVQWGVNMWIYNAARRAGVPIMVSDDCLGVGTIIRCADTYKFVEDVRPGDTVLAHDGTVQRVEATRGFFTEKESVRVSVGGVPIEMTTDHRVWARRAPRWPNGMAKHLPLVMKTVSPEWMFAGDLKNGDLVFTPVAPWVGMNDSWRVDLSTYFTHRHRIRVTEDELIVHDQIRDTEITSSRFVNFDVELAWILGFFVGDGNAHNNLSSWVADNEVYNTFLLPKLIDFATRHKFSFDEVKHKNHTIFRIIHTAFTQFMRRNFYDKNKKKWIPEWVRSMSLEWIKAFCSGLLFADGGASSTPGGVAKNYTLSLTSLQVAGFFRETALSLGLYCSIGSRRTTGSMTDLYTIQLPPETPEVFKVWEVVPYERKCIRRAFAEGGFWTRVRSVESLPSNRLVYDLQVSGPASYSTSAMAVHNSHFASPAEHIVQDIRLSSPSHTWKFHNSYHRFSSSEAWDYFRDRMGIEESEFRGWIDNSHAWVSKFANFEFDISPKLGSKFYPADTLGYTRELIVNFGRFKPDSVYVERLHEEIEMLHDNGVIDLLPYFMIDEEIVRVYRNQGWLTGPGRGSAGGLLLAYWLGITHVDPIRYGLSLARFMTPDRAASGKLPDIDQDLPFREPLDGGSDGKGWEVDVVEFVAEDGTTHVLPEIWKLETPAGLMTVDQAVASNTPVLTWWRLADYSPTHITVTRRSSTHADLPRRFHGWFKERFGDHIVQISTDHTLKLKMAVRDVARARRGFVGPDIEEFCKGFAQAPMGIKEVEFVLGYHSDSEGDVPGSIATDQSLQAYITSYPEDWEIVKKLLGLPRHRSKHACAFILGDRPISEFIPLTTVGGTKVTAFTAGPVEAVGGVKMDFLIVSSIWDIQTALELIRARHGLVDGCEVPGTPAHQLIPLPDRSGNADIWDLPPDSSVFRDFMNADTETVFQYNTDGVKEWLAYFRGNRADGRPLIDGIEDLSVITALDRPGPLNVKLKNPDIEDAVHNALVEYTRRAAGMIPTPDIHPAAAKLLPETYGVIVFQEQVQKIYQAITGCGGPEAENFRRNVAKKAKKKLEADYPRFMERATAILGTAEEAQGVWDLLETFSSYGFNLSHATCYAVTGYACAWLKHHYPLEWWCGLLRHAAKDKINVKLWPYIGHLIDLPDLGVSGADWDIRGVRIQAPMNLLAGIGAKAHAQLIRYAPYRSITDLADAIQRYKTDHVAIEAAAAEAATRKIAAEVAAAEAAGETVPEPTEEPVEEAEDVEPAEPAESQDAAVVKPKAPRSPIHRSIVWNLAVAGALNSLFPEGTPPEDQIAAFDAAMMERVGKKYKASMKKFPVLDTVGKYQVKKKVLAPYGEDIRPLLTDAVMADTGRLRRCDDEILMSTKRWDRDARAEIFTEEALLDFETTREMAEATTMPDGGYRCAAVCYIEEVRVFRWGPGKSNEGMELTVEIGGAKLSMTRWPLFEQSRIAEADRAAMKKGAVLAIIADRRKIGKSFAISDYVLVRGPLEKKKEK
jgi:DNA polymerase III alpha subunit